MFTLKPYRGGKCKELVDELILLILTLIGDSDIKDALALSELIDLLLGSGGDRKLRGSGIDKKGCKNELIEKLTELLK